MSKCAALCLAKNASVAHRVARWYNPPVRIAVTKDNYKGHRNSPWLVVVPRALSDSGKRVYRRFARRSEAHAFASAVRAQVRAEGVHPVAVLPSDVAADARAAAELLVGTGLSITAAVRQLLQLMQDTGVACAHARQAGGAGEADRGNPASASAAPSLREALAIINAAKSHQSVHTTRSRIGSCHTIFTRNPGFGDTPMDALSSADIHHALDTAWADSPSCWNSGRRVLHAMFQYFIKRRVINIENPVTPLEPQHVREREITALPPADLRRLLRTASDTAADLVPYLAICAFAGVRPLECSRLKWSDLDLEENVLSVRAHNSKTGGTRHIELQPTLRLWLDAYRPADAAPDALITPTRNLIHRLNQLRQAAGWQGKTWQNDCLRHSYATYYLKAKCGTLAQLQLNMGHRDTRLLYTRYTNMRGVTRDMAAEWWSLTPSTLYD